MSTAAAKKPSPATVADLLALPDEGRGWELMSGELVEKQAGFRHGRTQTRLNQLVLPCDEDGGGGGEAPGGRVFLTEQLVRFCHDTLRPDVAGWRSERIVEPPRRAGRGGGRSPRLDLRDPVAGKREPLQAALILQVGFAADPRPSTPRGW